ncbi:hypothetical protein NHX12_014297 [Muraenolepis orangiensis]|uniref:ACAD9/ACADV-like C-terminal domain-containing protein n=1 Tax=Muraenolepis orangiensis TaxID=630683 RepID=A0A9Q0DBQ5_9TELE|nr:hypothetical protein NHX12_014297 [Muraenolepis orangiensis]
MKSVHMKSVHMKSVTHDEPEGGPQHYFLLTGFLEAQLLPALEAVGVRVDNVIRVQQERGHYNTPERRDSTVVSSERPRRSQKHCVFWSSLGDVLDRGPALSMLQDVARLCYTEKLARMAMMQYVTESMAYMISGNMDSGASEFQIEAAISKIFASGHPSAQHEKMLCETWCVEAHDRITRDLRTLRSSQSRQLFNNLRAISAAVVENGGVVSPHPLGF